jgi:hypothetical protein
MADEHVKLAQFVQGPYERDDAFLQVQALAHRLHRLMNQPEVALAIQAANQPGTSSGRVQDVLLGHLQGLGFSSEVKGLFSRYATSQLRPDYYLRVGDTGILLEIERGKTTINNMDILDFWKCHLCAEAHHLFLMVPQALVQNGTMRPRNEFESVRKRLSTFFEPQNYTNVISLFLFGY